MSNNDNGMNLNYISYFPLEEYIERIKLLPDVLVHLNDTSNDFDEYMKKLIHNYDEEYIVDFWIYYQYEELMSSKRIENKSFNQRVL